MCIKKVAVCVKYEQKLKGVYVCMDTFSCLWESVKGKVRYSAERDFLKILEYLSAYFFQSPAAIPHAYKPAWGFLNQQAVLYLLCGHAARLAKYLKFL